MFSVRIMDEIHNKLNELYNDLVLSWRSGEPVSIETIDKLDEIIKQVATVAQRQSL